MNIYIADINNISKDSQKIVQYCAMLGPDELKQYNKITRPTRKLQFLVGHAMRHRFSTSEKFTSIAHKDNIVLVAVSHTPVGIDIENASIMRDFEHLGTAMNFTPTPDADMFYKKFTATEALYKLGPQKTSIFLSWHTLKNFIICIASTYEFKISRLIPFDNVNSDLLCVCTVASEQKQRQ